MSHGLDSYRYNRNECTNISKSFVYNFQKTSEQYQSEFAYVFHNKTGEFKLINHEKADETSVTYNTNELAKSFEAINTNSSTTDARQGHRHPNTVNQEQQGENRFLLSKEDKLSMKQRFDANPNKKEIFETLAVQDSDTTYIVTYSYDGNEFKLSESQFSNIRTTMDKPILKISEGIAEAFTSTIDKKHR